MIGRNSSSGQEHLTSHQNIGVFQMSSFNFSDTKKKPENKPLTEFTFAGLIESVEKHLFLKFSGSTSVFSSISNHINYSNNFNPGPGLFLTVGSWRWYESLFWFFSFFSSTCSSDKEFTNDWKPLSAPHHWPKENVSQPSRNFSLVFCEQSLVTWRRATDRPTDRPTAAVKCCQRTHFPTAASLTRVL